MKKNTASLLAKLLDYIKHGYTLREAAIKLGISEEEARLIYYTLAAQGLVTIIAPKASKCSCKGCPFRKYCTLNIKEIVGKKKS
ncbi:MAG: hypothetical protein F7C33_00630 [Desulfurococcales archaeon]|nr:hypothetical protein [Desulfurococcales archaeon]